MVKKVAAKAVRGKPVTTPQVVGSNPTVSTNSPWTLQDRGNGCQMCEAQFDSANRKVRLLTVLVQYHISMRRIVGWVIGSPERSPPSPDVVIAVRLTTKSGDIERDWRPGKTGVNRYSQRGDH